MNQAAPGRAAQPERSLQPDYGGRAPRPPRPRSLPLRPGGSFLSFVWRWLLASGGCVLVSVSWRLRRLPLRLSGLALVFGGVSSFCRGDSVAPCAFRWCCAGWVAAPLFFFVCVGATSLPPRASRGCFALVLTAKEDLLLVCCMLMGKCIMRLVS